MNTSTLSAAPATAATSIPAIRAAWPGLDGKYAGVAAGEAGAPDYHLVLLDVLPPKEMNWQDAMDWAKSMGADLPTRNESALLYAHLRDEFEKAYWYWTSTQYSSDTAWNQTFNDGYQDDNSKKFEAHARLVRRLPLQSFTPSATAAD